MTVKRKTQKVTVALERGLLDRSCVRSRYKYERYISRSA